jgi:phosphatidylglycerol:prolipoprotein diacylglycerol transferase
MVPRGTIALVTPVVRIYLARHVHSVAFQIGGFTVYWYGIFAALGFLTAFWTSSLRAPRGGLSPEVVVDLAPWLIGGAILGARVFYVTTHWEAEFAGEPLAKIFAPRSGLVWYGGLIGASLATIVHAYRAKVSLWKLADVIAPSIALGHAFGRVGCLMTGCCYGRPTDLPWAICFPKEHWTGGVPVHPTQIYEAVLNALLYGGLAWLFRRKRFDGQVFAAYLMGYAVLRAAVEAFRGDYPKYYLGGHITPAQLLSVGILAAGAILAWRLSVKPPVLGASANAR